MAYDEELAERIRDEIGPRGDVFERKMFGGLAFMVGGHLAVAASGQGGMLVRAAPDEWERLIEAGEAEPMEMRGTPMTGWLRVEAPAVTDAAGLRRWVETGVAYADSLPPKT
jgi:hypothetical protein